MHLSMSAFTVSQSIANEVNLQSQNMKNMENCRKDEDNCVLKLTYIIICISQFRRKQESIKQHFPLVENRQVQTSVVRMR